MPRKQFAHRRGGSGHKLCADSVILYPGTSARSAGNRRYQTDDNNVFAEQHFEGNVCAVEDSTFYSYFGCNATNVNETTYHSRFNVLFSDSSNFSACGATSFEEWQQQLGQDAGSVLAPTPSVAQLLALGAAKVLDYAWP